MRRSNFFWFLLELAQGTRWISQHLLVCSLFWSPHSSKLLSTTQLLKQETTGPQVHVVHVLKIRNQVLYRSAIKFYLSLDHSAPSIVNWRLEVWSTDVQLTGALGYCLKHRFEDFVIDDRFLLDGIITTCILWGAVAPAIVAFTTQNHAEYRTGQMGESRLRIRFPHLDMRSVCKGWGPWASDHVCWALQKWKSRKIESRSVLPFVKQNLYPDCKVTFEMPHQRQAYYWNMIWAPRMTLLQNWRLVPAGPQGTTVETSLDDATQSNCALAIEGCSRCPVTNDIFELQTSIVLWPLVVQSALLFHLFGGDCEAFVKPQRNTSMERQSGGRIIKEIWSDDADGFPMPKAQKCNVQIGR